MCGRPARRARPPRLRPRRRPPAPPGLSHHAGLRAADGPVHCGNRMFDRSALARGALTRAARKARNACPSAAAARLNFRRQGVKLSAQCAPLLGAVVHSSSLRLHCSRPPSPLGSRCVRAGCCARARPGGSLGGTSHPWSPRKNGWAKEGYNRAMPPCKATSIKLPGSPSIIVVQPAARLLKGLSVGPQSRGGRPLLI